MGEKNPARTGQKMRVLAVLCSGSGTNLQAIINAIRAKELSARIAVVISDNPAAFALRRAADAGIATVVVDQKLFPTRAEADTEIARHLARYAVELVVLAGYMRILTSALVRQYRNRIINIHPALLPAFKGSHAVRDALRAKVSVTGVTVHVVTEELDSGPIIMQREVAVYDGDTEETLLARIHTVEHVLYPEVIRLFTEGKIQIDNEKVHIVNNR